MSQKGSSYIHRSPLGAGGFENAMHSDAVGAQLFVQGSALTPPRRAELKAKLKAGALDELLFSAVVFREGPNSNHTRFRASDLAAFAESFDGVPFLRNHMTGDIGARDGTVVESRVVGAEFHQTIRLTTERGMRDFLEGVIDRFSIGWYFEGVECSICAADWFECSHWPGQKYEGQKCELIFAGPRGKETSAVNAPAVQGTRVIEQLCQLKRHSGMSGIEKVSAIGAEQIKERGMPVVENAIVLPDGSLKVVTPLQQPAAYDGHSAACPAPMAGTAIGAAQMGGRTDFDGHRGRTDNEWEAAIHSVRAEMEADRVEQLIRSARLSEEEETTVRLGAAGQNAASIAQLIEAVRRVSGSRLNTPVVRGIRPVTGSMMTTGQDRVQGALNWIFGVRDEPLPPPSMRSLRELYQAITGDYEWRGVFNPEWSQLSAASTSTLAGMAVNALNKVVRMHYDNMATYRWYERIVDVAPHDGTTHDVQLVMVDGLANLPIVAEGAAYTEASVGDSKEALSFTKRGHYVGITLETIRRSDIQRIQAIPRELVQSSVRTRSAAIASIFTANSGTGPTLADDSTVLFHANHGNVSTTAFGAAGWAAARTRIWEQLIPGTSKPLGLWPTFVLTPIELYDAALTEFGYGSGDIGKPSTAGTAQVVNPYGESRLGDPRPVPIPVPEWTDADDWAYMVDPRLHPVIHMAYANAPQGGQHPLPEIFEVTSESSGLLFTNDTLPVKVRDWWGYGIATYVGIGKNNV